MTDQQAPERIWFYRDAIAGWLGLRESNPGPDGVIPEHYVHHDLLEAAEKRIKELEDALIRSVRRENDTATAAEEWEMRYVQALASVGAVIEKAAAAALTDYKTWGERDVECDVTACEAVAQSIRSLTPDATAALNEMRADAWDAGRGSRFDADNPYRP